MLPYVPSVRNKEKGQRPDGKGPSHPSTGRPRRKAVIRPSRCLGPPRTGRRVGGTAGHVASRRRVKQRPQHLGPTRVRDPRAPPTRRPRLTRPRCLQSERRRRPRPALPPTSRPPSRWRRTYLDSPPWRLPARPALPLELRSPTKAPPPARIGYPLTASAEARPLPGAAARGRPGKDGEREGPAGAAGLGRMRARGGAREAEPCFAEGKKKKKKRLKSLGGTSR